MASPTSFQTARSSKAQAADRVRSHRPPRGLTAERVYEPDLERQVEALLYLLRASEPVALVRERSASAESAPAAGGEAA
jgi:hypothetical protein